MFEQIYSHYSCEFRIFNVLLQKKLHKVFKNVISQSFPGLNFLIFLFFTCIAGRYFIMGTPSAYLS